MSQEDSKHEGNKKMVIEIEEFYDRRLGESNQGEDKDQTIIPENFQNLEQNYGNKQSKDIKSGKKRRRRNRNKKTSIKKLKAKTDFRLDNYRKEAFHRVMIIVKILLQQLFGLTFDSFNCDDVLGISIRHFYIPLKSKIYQLLCYYPKIKKDIMNVLKSDIPKHIKRVFEYFMTRTYEELFTRYVSGDINFPIFDGGTLRICSFPTLQKEIEKKEMEKEDQRKINTFAELSENMIDDINSKKYERQERKKKKKKKVFKPVIIKKFEDLRKMFNEDGNTKAYTGIELEE